MKTCPAMQRGLGRPAGFTLLETLVALVVLGFLMVGLTQGVRAGLSLWDAQVRRTAQTAELDAAARIVRTLFSGITLPQSVGTTLPPSAALAAATSGPPFKGTSDIASFVGDLPTGLGTTQRADITLELRQGRFVLSWTPHRHELSTAPAPPSAEAELVRNVDRVEFAYWGSSSPGEPASWQAQWDGPGIPQLIRLRLAFPNGDQRRFPDLIAAPQF